MSDYFEVFIGKIETELGADTAWEVFHNIEGFIGEIAVAITKVVSIFQKNWDARC